MSDARVHLAHSRGAPLRPEVRRAMQSAYEQGGNPSSLHGRGRAARRVLESVREALAETFGWPHRILFTGGLSESVRLARSAKERWEHHGLADHWHAAWDSSLAEAALRGEEATLSLGGEAGGVVQGAHGGLGIRWPLSAWLERTEGHFVVLDASTLVAGGAPATPWDELAVDAVVFDGRSIGAPPGVGCLFLRDEATVRAEHAGGGQEYELRPGTQAVPLVAGLGEAVRLALETVPRAWLSQLTACPGLELWRPPSQFELGNTALVRKDGTSTDELISGLAAAGVEAQRIPPSALESLAKADQVSGVDGWVSLSSGREGIAEEEVTRLTRALGS